MPFRKNRAGDLPARDPRRNIVPMEPESEHSEVRIRTGDAGDYDRIVAVWSEAGLPFRPLGRDSRENVRREAERARSTFFLAECEGRVVGVVLATHDGRKGWINRLAVVPDHRGQGLASTLVGRAEEWLASEGIEVWAALIESDNTGSMMFFERTGYIHDRGVEYFSKRRSTEM